MKKKLALQNSIVYKNTTDEAGVWKNQSKIRFGEINHTINFIAS